MIPRRLMLEEIRRHSERGESFGLETTLAGKSYAKLIPMWQSRGYSVRLIFLSLPSVESAIERVANRVAQGGHDIPRAVIARRFDAGWHNFLVVYRPIVDHWRLFENSGRKPVLVSQGGKA